MSPELSEEFLRRLEGELACPGIIGLALTGSHARGEASESSDVDILRFVEVEPREPSDRYRLEIVYGRLVSVSTTSVEAKRRELEGPDTARFAVPGLRQARVLSDRNGCIRDLVTDAARFRWASVEERARELVSYHLMGCAEEVGKVLGALQRRELYAAVLGAMGLVSGMAEAMALASQLLVESENFFFRELYAAAGDDSPWARLHRAAAGFEPAASQVDPKRLRSHAALHLYLETAERLRDLIEPQHALVVEHACDAIRDNQIPNPLSGHRSGRSA